VIGQKKQQAESWFSWPIRNYQLENNFFRVLC